jgi:hypothetical protein
VTACDSHVVRVAGTRVPHSPTIARIVERWCVLSTARASDPPRLPDRWRVLRSVSCPGSSPPTTSGIIGGCCTLVTVTYHWCYQRPIQTCRPTARRERSRCFHKMTDAKHVQSCSWVTHSISSRDEMFVCFESHEQFFSYLTTVTITGDRAANLDLCLPLMAFSSEGSFTCHTYCDMRPPYLRSSEKPVILTSECRALDEGAITTYFKRRPTRAGLELTTSRMLSESTTTRLRQPDQMHLLKN